MKKVITIDASEREIERLDKLRANGPIKMTAKESKVLMGEVFHFTIL